jgi:elongation factor Ts
MSVTAEAVKQLRERTGAGMMECKKALVETGGNLDSAAELMRKQGLAKADKKATRIAAEGVIVLEKAADGRSATMIEVNCETDFVAREADFQRFAADVVKAAATTRARDVETLAAAKLASGQSVDEARRGLIAKIGENISVRRVAQLSSDGTLGAYLHGSRIGALVAVSGGDAALAHDLAMHVAASNPRYLSAADVPAGEVAHERDILVEAAKSKSSGKPPEIIAKMVEGQLRKAFNDVSLMGQPFVKDDKQTVEQLLKKAGASVKGYCRFEVGAGIEKKQDDFVGEVMAQVKASSK